MNPPATAQKKRPPLHPLERAFVAVTAVHLVFLPWAFGTMHAWSQATSLGLAALGMVFATLPRRYTAEQAGGQEVMLHPMRRLLRFPLFWTGLGLMLLMVVQSLNPAWQFTHDDKKWWLVGTDHVSWLPSSTETPYWFFNLWRQFIFWASAWLVVCSLWIGITRRKSLQALLYVLAANALIIGAVAVVHKLDGTYKILWIRSFKGAAGFGSFVYHNHGAAYIALASLMIIGIAAWHQIDARRKLARSSPGMVWLFAGLALALTLLFSGSRAGFGVLAVTLVAAAFAWLFLKSNTASTTPKIVGAMIGLMMFAVAGYFATQADYSKLEAKFEKLMKQGDKEYSYQQRILSRERAINMLEENWKTGTGAGSFRFLFPAYISDDPRLYEGGRAFWEHAHIDWLQIPIEYGATGVLLIAVSLLWCVWRWIRYGGARHPIAAMIFLGCAQTLLHALVDFPFQNPAILITWWALIMIGLRWLDFDNPNRVPISTKIWETPKRPEHLDPLKIPLKLG